MLWKKSDPLTEPVGTIFRIQRYAIHDGPGIRTTVFLQGCPLSCQWCHNPESQPFAGDTDPETPWTVRRFTVSDMIREIQQDLIFFDQSQGGVTFSGGEPLVQHRFLTAILDRCKEMAIHTAVDTSGYAPQPVMEAVATRADLILFDLKLADSKDHRQYTGVPVEPVLESLKTLSSLGCRVRLRLPVIPGITDTPENLGGLVDLLATFTMFREINLLPFHKTGEGKYHRLGLPNPMQGINPPSGNRMETVRAWFERHGFTASIGG